MPGTGDDNTHPVVARVLRRERRLLVLLSALFLLCWSVMGLLFHAGGRPRLQRVAELDYLLDTSEYVMQLDCGRGAAIMDTDLSLNCFSLAEPHLGRIADPGGNFSGNFTAWQDVGYVSCGLDGSIALWDPAGRELWQRSLAEDAGLDPGEVLTMHPRVGNDGRLYVFRSGHCHVYDAAGEPQEQFFLHGEMDLAAPLLIMGNADIYFTTKTGKYWRALPSPDGSADRRVEELPLIMQRGNPVMLSEGVFIPWNSRGRNQQGEQRERLPLLLAVRIDHKGVHCMWKGESGGGNMLLMGGDVLRHHQLIPNGNLVVISDALGNNSFYWNAIGVSQQYEIHDLRRPVGEFHIKADPQSGRITMLAAQYETGAVLELLRQAAQRWPVLDGLTRMHGGGLLIYDPVMHSNHLYGLPRGAELLGWPDADGRFLVLEDERPYARVVLYDIGND